MTTDQTTADIDLIQRIIPHRYPFLLIDKVVDIVDGKTATGIKNVTFNEPHFQGHFPGTPIMPGVTIIEAMAQTAAVDGRRRRWGSPTRTSSSISWRSTTASSAARSVPGDVLKLHVETQRGGGKVWKFTGRADGRWRTGREAEFTAMMDLPKD